jgi:hypothetical protein
MTVDSEVLQRLQTAIQNGSMPEGLLFHGTTEPLKGPLRPGGDGVFWTTDNPRVAQQYMPSSGGKEFFGAFSDFERDTYVRPTAGMPWFEFSKTITGHTDADFDVETDAYGRTKSFRIPPGWLRNGEAAKWLERELGYAAGRDHWVKSGLSDPNRRYYPIDYQMPGHLLVTVDDGLTFSNLRKPSEPDLMAPEHNNLALFANADAGGHAGIIINDFCQTEQFGNVGHVSYGILPNRLSTIEWVTIPATRFEVSSYDDFQTMPSELVQWVAVMEESFQATALKV